MSKIEKSSMTLTDSKGKVLREAKEDFGTQKQDFKWWEMDEEDMAPAIVGTLKFIQTHQGSRMEQLTVSTRLYGANMMYNMSGAAFTRASSVSSNPSSQRVTINVCESMTDAIQAKMAKTKIIPTYVTNGGDWKAQTKAKNLTKFTHGLFHAINMHKKTMIALQHGCVWGDGFVHPYLKDGKIMVEPTYPHELFVDMIESLAAPPQQLIRVKIMDRDLAYGRFPELSQAIEECMPANYQDIGGSATSADLITVCEGWHLRSGGSAKDGVHAIAIGDGAMAEKWDKDYFPFPHLRYATRPFGWYGQGLCERIQNLQGEINRTMITKQKALWQQAAFKILVEESSGVVTQHLTNDIAPIIRYRGIAPQYINPPATNPETQEWIDQLINYAYSQEGLSRMSSTGEAPLGVESGKALRTLVQISDDRYTFLQQCIEDFVLNTAAQCIDLVREEYKSKGKYEVVFPDKTYLETVDWKDINLSEEQYVLKAFPSSTLSDDLEGRLSEIQELAQAGWVSPRTARRLLDVPDIEVNDALANAPEDRLHQIIEKMLDDGEAIQFQPAYHDAGIGKQLSLEYINYAELHGCPDDRVQLVRDFLNEINTASSMLAAAAQPPGAPGGAPANPTATPTSPLLSNVNGGAQ